MCLFRTLLNVSRRAREIGKAVLLSEVAGKGFLCIIGSFLTNGVMHSDEIYLKRF